MEEHTVQEKEMLSKLAGLAEQTKRLEADLDALIDKCVREDRRAIL